jgi:AcrR family transcriptional regulator
MPTHRINAADPAALIALLWDGADPPTRGPRRGLTLAEVVRAGIVLADTHGLDELSMRRLAAHLAIAPMSLYTYVPGKAELLDAMLDRLYLDMPRPPMAGLTPRERVQSVAEANWALSLAHPWTMAVATTRPGLGPGATRKYDYELAAFDSLGFTDLAMDSWLTLLLTTVRGVGQLAAEMTTAHQETGDTDAQWWERAGPALARYVTPEEYPLATRVGAAAGSEHGAAIGPEHLFHFAMARFADALDAAIVQGAKRPGRRQAT